ncbi:hypothetical protein C8R44DRAFT_731375 [Mycena epipterygia]|nr:hypothetical protein C8R44DRAFT_731375 [Mycena epipterygia]
MSECVSLVKYRPNSSQRIVGLHPEDVCFGQEYARSYVPVLDCSWVLRCVPGLVKYPSSSVRRSQLSSCATPTLILELLKQEQRANGAECAEARYGWKVGMRSSARNKNTGRDRESESDTERASLLMGGRSSEMHRVFTHRMCGVEPVAGYIKINLPSIEASLGSYKQPKHIKVQTWTIIVMIQDYNRKRGRQRGENKARVLSNC